MDTKWLEDFVSLAETRSFSRSAQLRHVTQPAFSRRIQALEVEDKTLGIIGLGNIYVNYADVERFELEAVLLRELSHPSVVAYVAHGETAGMQGPTIARVFPKEPHPSGIGHLDQPAAPMLAQLRQQRFGHAQAADQPALAFDEDRLGAQLGDGSAGGDVEIAGGDTGPHQRG